MIYILAPVYNSSSNGIKLIFELAHILNSRNIEAKLVCVDSDKGSSVPAEYRDYYINIHGTSFTVSEDDVVVYNDTTIGNPLNARYIIRWLLNCPYCLTGEGIHYKEDEIVVAYSKLISETLPQLFFMMDDRIIISKFRREKVSNKASKTVSIYFGKVHRNVIEETAEKLKNILKDFDKVQVITRNYPSSRHETLFMVANSDLLISYDPLTNMNYEAELLGVPALLMEDSYNTAKVKFNVKQSFMYDYSDFSATSGDIDSVYEEYCKYLDNQTQIVGDTFLKLLSDIEVMKTDKKALAANKGKNELQEKEDYEVYTKSKTREPFENIFTYEQIPYNVLVFLGIFNDRALKHLREERMLTIPVIGFIIRIKRIISNILNIQRYFDDLYIKTTQQIQELQVAEEKNSILISQLKEEIEELKTIISDTRESKI